MYHYFHFNTSRKRTKTTIITQGLYEKLMSKYEADPEDPMAKFSRAQPKVSGAKGSKKEMNFEQRELKLGQIEPR